MRLDYWNHPMILKAFRVKYRGGRLFTFAASYLILLLAGGVVLFHYRTLMGVRDWARVYFVCMISLQFVFSSIIAISSTSNSMQMEVTSRTLDLQRIATLRPAEILIGKAVGEPASSYLLAMATIPIAVLCCTVSNIPPLTVAILYMTLGTTTFLMACLGLQHPLDPASKGGQAAGVTGAILFGTFMATGMPLRFGPRGGFLELISGAVGLFTPILSIKGVATDGSSIWTATMPFFQSDIPYALLTPLTQVATAGLALLFMTRRLTQPLSTPLSKLQSYVVLLSLDLIWAAFQFNALNLGEGLTAPAVRFAAGHMVFALLMAGRTTPGRETFRSWVWRLRGKQPWIVDNLIGERTMNLLALAVYCLTGPAVFFVTIAVPVMLVYPDVLARTNWPSLVNAAATCVLVIVAYGLFYQVAAITIGRGAGMSVLVAATLIMAGPWLLGTVYDIRWLPALSPIAMFINLQDPNAEAYPILPLIALHALGAIFWTWALSRIVSRTVKQVDHRLRSMSLAST
jgi:hypothetical protein